VLAPVEGHPDNIDFHKEYGDMDSFSILPPSVAAPLPAPEAAPAPLEGEGANVDEPLDDHGNTRLYVACATHNIELATELFLAGGTLGDHEEPEMIAWQIAAENPQFWTTHARAAEAARTRRAELSSVALDAALAVKDKELEAKDAIAARLWKLVDAIPGAPKPSVAAVLADPALLVPFELHLGQQ